LAGSFSEDRPLGWDPAAAGSRAGDGMARLVSEEKATRRTCITRRMQEAVVGAAASKTQAMCGGCWEPQSELVSEEKATRRTCITSFL